MRFSILILMVAGFSASGQLRQRLEIGGGLGTFNYTGDLARTYDFRFSKPAATLFYRINFSQVVSLRTSVKFGTLAGSDKINPLDPAAAQRKASFKAGLVEFSPVFEYHFIDWRDANRRVRYSPYLFFGAGLFIFNVNTTFSGTVTGPQPLTPPPAFSRVQVSIPFGGGFKYVLNPNWYVALDFGMRETFFDYLDGISSGNVKYKTYRYGNPKDLDNYFFLGLTLTRTFYDIPCATNPY
ncbi:MAG: DUF6089 family protein [Bacteroidota bacterium]